jgi:hypothetical protein
MDEKHLIFAMVNQLSQAELAPRQIRLRQLAFENGKLQMVPIPAHGLKDLPQPLLIRNVVTNQVGLPHN